MTSAHLSLHLPAAIAPIRYQLNMALEHVPLARRWPAGEALDQLCAASAPVGWERQIRLLELDGAPGETHYDAEVREAIARGLGVALLEAPGEYGGWPLPTALELWSGDATWARLQIPNPRAAQALEATALRLGAAGLLLIQLPDRLDGAPARWYAAEPAPRLG